MVLGRSSCYRMGRPPVATERKIDTVTFFDRNSGKMMAQTHAGKEPDGALFEPPSGFIFVFNSESHDATVINCPTTPLWPLFPWGYP